MGLEDYANILAKLFFLSTIFGLGLFIESCLHEHEKRALFLSVLILAGYLILSFLLFLQATHYPGIYLLVDLFYLLLSLLLFFPFSRYSSPRPFSQTARYDERDIMFARARYKRGTPEYLDYYQRHPERKKIDDEIRSAPGLLSPGGRYYDSTLSRQAQETFALIENIVHLADGRVSDNRVENEPRLITRHLKEMAQSLGAVDAGVARLEPSKVYSHVGRGPGGYGTPISLDHPYVLVLAVEMDFAAMQHAPQAPVVVESSKKYLQASTIAIWIASVIRGLGYKARAHVDMNYRMILPAVAVDAGLGEIGRLGILIHPHYGPRIRLAAVSTNMPLSVDEPIEFGVQKFCEACKKCAVNCPGGAISHGKRKEVRGVRKWSTNQEACYRYWRYAGTDCGLCIRVCPYSRPNTLIHNTVRIAAKNSPFGRWLSILADRIFYGNWALYRDR